jgi:DNA-binding PadR family transcriptional regulator
MRTPAQTLAVLAVLAKMVKNWHYGYDLSKVTGLKSGTLYPILTRLHDQGWLETRWQEATEAGRPPRHLYRLTPLGLTAAKKALLAKPAKKQSLRPAYEN